MQDTTAKKKTPIYKVLYFQVICAIVIGVLLGHFVPDLGAQMKREHPIALVRSD